jgi:hypothetical protein
MSSLSSVKNSNACEFISPSPAIFTNAGSVPSSDGPFGARSSARSKFALASIPATAAITNTLVIRSLLSSAMGSADPAHFIIR